MSITASEHVFEAANEMYAELCRYVAGLATEAIRTRGLFSIVLTGGKTVQPLYQQLRCLDTRWAAWRVFWGDERCLHASHAERNSSQAFNVWLDHVPISAANIFPIPAEMGPVVAAKRYCDLLADTGPFDLVLLSLGEDGHVASIFPGENRPNTAAVLPVERAPYGPAQRVTLSLERLAQSRRVLLLAGGANKQAALTACRNGEPSPATELCGLVSVEIWADCAATGAE